RFRPGAALDPAVAAVGDLTAAVRGAEVVVSAAPSHAVRDVMTRARDKIGRGALVVSVSKGLDPERLSTPSCVLADVLPKDAPIAVLSGPSFAREVYARQPTAVVAAAREHATAQRVQQVFSTGFFRVYSATDVLGVELAGALKNVIALAAGILEGLGMGHNTRAALITRGLAEITRLGVALGAEPATFAGLAGMGGLILTATGPLSRNHPSGVQAGAGRRLERAPSRAGVLFDRRGVPAHRPEAARTAVLGEPVPLLEPRQEPVREPGVPTARDRADHAREAPALHGEIHHRGSAPENRAISAQRGPQAGGASRARDSDGQGPARRAQVDPRHSRGERV